MIVQKLSARSTAPVSSAHSGGRTGKMAVSPDNVNAANRHVMHPGCTLVRGKRPAPSVTIEAEGGALRRLWGTFRADSLYSTCDRFGPGQTQHGVAGAPRSVANWKGKIMKSHIYKVLELVGSSETSIEDAVTTAIAQANKTIRNMDWFEIVQTRGHIENGKIGHYQVTLKIGFTLE
jgi:dodecin